ncbi:MAG: flagellar hook-associated protein FlgL [Bacteriovoracaceae bacterium]|nr:flagellar hook-associated protein FlgL [Bacteriovoracaceae bacterium]
MTRVSENSSSASLQFSLNKAKSKLENLQLKGASLKRITRPSDDPVSNIEALNIGAITSDNKQFLRNCSFSLLQLNATEKSVEQLTEIMNKAKEIAIAQSSDFYDSNIRKNVANEIKQLRNQALSIANKRVGSRYIFAGHSTLTKPFTIDGEYKGDDGKMNLEISKDFFVPINLTGTEIFFGSEKDKSYKIEHPLEKIPEFDVKNKDVDKNSRGLASKEAPEVKTQELNFTERENIFTLLSGLSAGLENNDSGLIQDLLNKFDTATSRLITLRTRIGSIYNSVESSQSSIEAENIDHAERKSYLVDADIAELFTDITRQKNILETTYQSSQQMMNKSLLNFLR